MRSDISRFSAQIDLMRFAVVVGLVFLHYGSFVGSSYDPFNGFNPEHGGIALFVSSYFVFFFYSAVPLLSVISGYLFFKEVSYSADFFLKRFRSRFRSIFLPMLSWNAIALLLSAAVALLVPAAGTLVAYDVFNLTLMDLANALVGITRRPADFQFWFLHDLLLTVLISPVLAFLIRRFPLGSLLVLATIWFVNLPLPLFFRTDVLFFFSIGAAARIHDWDVENIASRRTAISLLIAYSLFVAVRTAAPIIVPEDFPAGRILVGSFTRFMRLFGVVTLWSLAPFLIQTSLGSRIARLGVVAFFLHAIHWPLNQLIKRTLDWILPDRSEPMLLANYFVTASVTVLLAVVIARALNKYAPPIFNHLSGGRSEAFGSRLGDRIPGATRPATSPDSTHEPQQAQNNFVSRQAN